MHEQHINRDLVTLSIVSHGDAKQVKQLLDSLLRYESAELFQIIITDNLGDDVPDLKESEWQSLHILRNKNPLGFAANHNQAFQLAIGRYFCVLNPDVLFEQEVFSSLIRLLENRQADIVAPLIVDAEAANQDSFRDFPTPDWIAGIFMLMISETYHALSGFDEKYRLYFEDVDLCARAQLAGLKLLIETNVRIRHDAHRASRKNPIYLLWHIQSAVRFFTSDVYRNIYRSSE